MPNKISSISSDDYRWQANDKEHLAIHKDIDDLKVETEKNIDSVKEDVKALSPAKWPAWVKLSSIILLITFIGSIITAGTFIGKTVTREQFDPIVTDVAIIKEKIRASSDDRRIINNKLDTILKNVQENTQAKDTSSSETHDRGH